MAEEFQGGVCGDTWWNPPRNMLSGGDGGGWLSPCSVAQIGGGGYDMTNFGWTNEAMKDNGLVCDMMSTMVFQADLDSTFDIFGFGTSSISSPTDWNQSNLLCNGGDDENFELMIQDDINSRNCCEMTTNSPTIMNSNNFMIDNNNSFGQEGSSPMTMTTSSNSSEDSSTINNELSNLNTSFYMSSYLIQTLFDDTNDPQLTDPNYGEPMSSNELVNHGQGSKGQCFEDTTLSNIEVSMMNSLLSRSQTSKSKKKSNNCSTLVTKVTNEDICDSNGNINEQPPAKRLRIEAPSSLPTFKVRKEKLGDRITALQQIVSPFGKTDTASVLHEAIEYIKFLHAQVNALSTPYMTNNGAAIQQQQDFDMLKNKNEHKQDLRSQGLCLMPISSTYPIAQETPVDFWTPTFGTSPLL